MRFRDFLFLPLMFGILSGIMTKAGLPAWVVSLAVGIGAIAIFSGYIDQFAGPMSLWGRAIVAVFVLSAGWAGFYAASPWYLRDAWDSRKEESMMRSADGLRSNEPYTLQQDLYMKEDEALAAEEEIEATKVRAIPINPKTGKMSDEDREVWNAAKRKIATLRTRRQELKLLMEGESNSTSSFKQRPLPVVDELRVSCPSTQILHVSESPLQIIISGRCTWMSAPEIPVRYTYSDGSFEIDGPGIMLPHKKRTGSIAKDNVFRVAALPGQTGKVLLTLTKDGG